MAKVAGVYAPDGSQYITITDGAGNPVTAGTVTSVSITTANGISGVVATATTTPAITLTLGAITPTSAVINVNAVAGPTALAGDLVRLLQADGVTNRITLETAAANNAFGGRASGGTMAVPAATPNLTSLVLLEGFGYTNAYTTASNARISLMVDSVWSASNAATRISLFTTPTGTTAKAEAMRIQPSGGASIGATAITIDPGIGSLNIDAKLSVGGNAGFNGTAPVAKPTVTGSKVSGAALVSLLAALVSYGLITDSTSA